MVAHFVYLLHMQILTVFNCFGQHVLEVIRHFTVIVVRVSLWAVLMRQHDSAGLSQLIIGFGNFEHFLKGVLTQACIQKSGLKIFSLLGTRSFKHRNLKSWGCIWTTRLFVLIIFTFIEIRVLVLVLGKFNRADRLNLFLLVAWALLLGIHLGSIILWPLFYLYLDVCNVLTFDAWTQIVQYFYFSFRIFADIPILQVRLARIVTELVELIDLRLWVFLDLMYSSFIFFVLLHLMCFWS